MNKPTSSTKGAVHDFVDNTLRHFTAILVEAGRDLTQFSLRLGGTSRSSWCIQGIEARVMPWNSLLLLGNFE